MLTCPIFLGFHKLPINVPTNGDGAAAYSPLNKSAKEGGLARIVTHTFVWYIRGALQDLCFLGATASGGMDALAYGRYLPDILISSQSLNSC